MAQPAPSSPEPPPDADAYRGPVVVIGASAGGIGALRRLVGALPADFDVPIVVVVHVASSVSALPQIIARHTPLEVCHPTDGHPLRPGHVLVAPPDRHLVLEDHRVRVTTGPRENGFRPSVDALFRSAASDVGPELVAIVLSGMLDDGAYGLRVVSRRGGVGVVQDPDTADFPDMPRAAVEAGGASLVLDIDEIASHLSDVPSLLARHGSGPADISTDAGAGSGELSPFICPNCGGSLWEHDDESVLRFQCRTGHAYSPESLLDVQAAALDDALWGAYRALLERVAMAERLAGRFSDRGMGRSGERWRDIAAEAQRRAATLNELLTSHPSAGTVDPAAT